jgi:hypothetical protein
VAREFLTCFLMSSNQATMNPEIERIGESVARPGLVTRISVVAGSGARTLVVGLILAAAATLTITGDTSRLCSFLTKAQIVGIDSTRALLVPDGSGGQPKDMPTASGRPTTNCSFKGDRACSSSRLRALKRCKDVRHRNNRPCPLENLVATHVTISVQGQSAPFATLIVRPFARAAN